MKRSVLLYSGVLCLILSCAYSNEGKRDAENVLSPGSFIFRLYEDGLDHLSAVRAGECPMYPSCSSYSKQVMVKHGVAVGWVMTADRLMRCGRDEMELSPLIYVDGKWKYYDPVERNDFWWSKK